MGRCRPPVCGRGGGGVAPGPQRPRETEGGRGGGGGEVGAGGEDVARGCVLAAGA